MKSFKHSSLLLLLFSWLLASSLAFSYSPLKITVYTDKAAYTSGEKVEIYGEVALDSTPLENVMVALEVRDPSSSPIISRTVETNSLGSYAVTFTLDSESPLGNYTVSVSCSYNGEEASNSSSFSVEYVPRLVLTVETNTAKCKPGQTINVFGIARFGDLPVQGVLVAVEVQNPEGTPIIMRVLQTDEQGSYQLPLTLTLESVIGDYNVYVSATYQGKKATAHTTFEVYAELLTDINKDGLVNIIDLTLVAVAWSTRPGDPGWDPRCDIDANNVVNIIDLTLVARDFGKTV